MRLFMLLNLLLELYKVALLIYAVLSWLHTPANRWTVLLQRIIEPALKPIRRVVQSKLGGPWQMLDWSVLVLFLLIGVAQTVLRLIFSALLW